MNTQNQRTRDVSKVSNQRQIITLAGLVIANLLISFWMGQQAYSWMPPQASAESILVDQLFSFMTAVGTFIFLGVIGTLLYSILFQRAAKYDPSDGPPIEGNIKLEIIWTAIPILLIIWIGTVSFQTYDKMSILGDIAPKEMHPEMQSAQTVTNETVANETVANAEKNPTLNATEKTADFATTESIEVRSRQWAWEFRYPQAGVSSTELHLPVNQRAQFKLTSDDVLHGFYVPAFRVKQDIIPGKEIDFAFTPIRKGRYRLRDSEYSGTYFAANQTNVVVESAADYQQWLKAAAATPPTQAENVAQTEFTLAQKNNNKNNIKRWATVKPAPAPIVNHSSSEQDSYE